MGQRKPTFTQLSGVLGRDSSDEEEGPRIASGKGGDEFKPSMKAREALQRLRRSAGASRTTQGEFERLVLSHLALIRDRQALITERQALGGKKVSNPVQRQRRVAGRCRRFADYLVSNPPSVGVTFGSLRPSALADDLRLYAQELETLADARPAQGRKPPRHHVHPVNREIVDLLRFIRHLSGKLHLDDMAVLLGEATGDKGLSARRLAALWRDHQKRPRGWLTRFLSHPARA